MHEPALLLPEPSAAAPAVIGQALLFSPEIEIEIEKEEARGRYTLERFKVRRPAAYQDCIALLAASKPGYEGLRRIAKIVEVHWLTVAGVRDDQDEGKTIDTLRERLSKKALTAAEILIDRVLEHPDLIPPGMLGMVLDQLVKNAELLGNRATARTERMAPVNIYDEWDAVLEKLADAREVESSPGIGLVGGNLPVIEAPIDGAPAGQAGATGPASDAESPVSAADAEVIPVTGTASDTEPSAEPSRSPSELAAERERPDARNGAGGGSRRDSGGGQNRSGYNEQNFIRNRPQVRPPPI